MNEIGVRNLEFALSRHTRQIDQDNWQVGANATTTDIPTAIYNPSGTAISLSAAVISDLTGGRIEFTTGANKGAYRTISAITASGEITLDEALTAAPAEGDRFVVMKPLTVNAVSSENIKEIGGTAQTGADWTALFQTLTNTLAAMGSALPARATLVGGSDGTDLQALALDTKGRLTPQPRTNEVFINGLSVAAATDILNTALSPSVEGTYNIRVLVSAASAVSVVETPTGAPATGGSATATTGTLNSGNNLTANAWYEFDFMASSQATYNFQASAACTISLLVQFSQAQ